jgi:hypothetical protein
MLVNEILNRLPSTVWTSESTTFLDPAMGAGQFVSQIEKRLKAHGHSKANIAKRVFGLESSAMQVAIAVNLGKLIGTYAVDKDHEGLLSNRVCEVLGVPSMKFDVVVGNPPYQETSDTREGESSRSSVRLWEKFLQVGMDVLSDDGDLMFVTPAHWVGSTSSSFNLLSTNTVVFADLSDSVKNSFGGVGGSMRFSWYWAKKGKSSVVPLIKFNDAELEVDLFNMEFQPVKSSSGLDYSICQKLHAFTAERLSWKRQDNEHAPLAKYEVSVHRAKGSNFPVEVTTDGSGIGYTFSTNNKAVASAVAHNMGLKLYKHLRWVLRPGMALVSTFTLLPVPTEKMSDRELYDHFGLSEEERAHVDRTIK